MTRWNRILLAALLSLPASALAGGDAPSEFTNQGSIVNTRHNLTQRNTDGSQLSGIQAGLMDSQRNDYGEICVYCHTPHGANSQIAAPLWNHSIPSSTYTTYDQLGTTTLTQTVSTPGPNSLTCLSCHDGTVAIDSIINMPGSGYYDAGQEVYSAGSAQTFLDQWAQDGNTGPSPAQEHVTMRPDGTGCMVCHTPNGAGTAFPTAPDFAAFLIGTDLRNDHPVGVTFPNGSADFFDDAGQWTAAGNLKFRDLDADGRADPDEIRTYNTGGGFEVECASCHDPHGVDNGGTFNATFLRVSNAGSGVCLTCHNK